MSTEPLRTATSQRPTRRVVVALAVATTGVLGVDVYRVADTTDADCGAFASWVNSASDRFSDAPVGDVVLLDDRLRQCRHLTDDGQSIDPSISPDGRQVAFISGRGYASDEDYGTNEFQSAYVMAIDGSGQRRLATTIALPPLVWAPDGRRIAYVSNPSRTQVSIVDVDTGHSTEMAIVPPCTIARWMDTDHLAFLCARGHLGIAIESVDVHTSVRQLVTILPTAASLWAPPYAVVLPATSRATELVVWDLRNQRTHRVSGSHVVPRPGSYTGVVLVTSDGHLIWQRHDYLGSYDLYLSDLSGGPPRLLRRQHGRGFPGNLSDNPALQPSLH